MADEEVPGGRWAQRVALFLLSLLVLLYLGAKTHFYTRFRNTTVEGYVGEHWPFWAGMILVAVALFVIGRLVGARPRPGRDSSNGT